MSPAALPRCERCAKRVATVTLGDQQEGARMTYRVCSDCWAALGDLVPRARRTDEDAVVHWIIDRLRDERLERERA